MRGAAPDGPLQPVPASEPSAFPLVINQNGYALESQTSTVIPTNVTAGQPVAISVMMHDSTQISYFAVYLHRSGGQISHLQSDAQIIWDSGEVRMTDPSGLMHNATITMSEDPGDPSIKTATLTVSFSEGMGETNMVVRTWNADGQITEVRVFDALAVTPPGQAPVDPEPVLVDPEPVLVDPEPVLVDPEPTGGQDTAGRDTLAIRMWSGFEHESITDAQLPASLGLNYPGIDTPSWVMTELGPLVARGDVTVNEFRTAPGYVVEHVVEHVVGVRA